MRQPGGAKNKKSGTVWTKEELLEVYFLYKKLKGKGLHERNPEIIRLAHKLGRTVRSTEAQSIMYRNLERSGDYSHGNMNKLCKEIWEEYEHFYVPAFLEPKIPFPDMEEEEKKFNNIKERIPFPAGLLEWAGHKRGGVKKPFDKETGRPNGSLIETQLTEKLNQWVKELGPESPRIILLIGGPGNGKTDALEHLIMEIDSTYRTDFFWQISENIKKGGDVAPRSISLDLDSSIFDFDKLTIVQDASTGEENLSSADSLLRDLENALEDRSIYIAGINRGILAETVSKASEKPDSKVYSTLNNIIHSLTHYINPKPLWPLGNTDSNLREVAVWPMDVESLVKPRKEIETTPAYQIIKEAVKDENWDCSDCPVQDFCPFIQNKIALQDTEKVTGLLQLLSDFEIIANNRWTFREIFSLISYILVGSENEFGNQKPCVWAKGKVELINDSNVGKRVQALWDLNEHLYHFRLFNKWPNFNSIARSQKKEIKDILQTSEITKEVFKYLSYAKARKTSKPDIAHSIDENFFPLIDPGQLSNDSDDFGVLIAPVRKIEAEFSYSVGAGLDLVQGALNPLEKLLFLQLREIEKDLDERARFEPTISSMRVEEILVHIKSLASRYFKRIHFTAKGISKDEIYLKEYRKLNPVTDPDLKGLKQAKLLFDDLIQPKGSLCLTLNSSISQPQLEPQMAIILETQRIKIRHEYILDDIKDVPRNSMKVFEIKFKNNFHVPLTYQLYKALFQLSEGVRPSSLPTAVLAMLDGIKSKLAGELVRNPDKLSTSKLKIGISESVYRIDEAERDIELTIQN